MKKIIRLIILAFIIHTCLPVAAIAQNDIKQQIADTLAVFPSQNKEQLHQGMQAITALGESGLTQIAASLRPAGSGDNTKVEFAIGSYSYYVIQQGKEEQRQMAVHAYISALGQLQDNTSRQFIIKQLQQIGKDDAVPALKNYLADEQLSDPAARALAQIKTHAAEDALLKALSASNGTTLQSIIEALGYTGYTPALEAITNIANTTDIPLRKVCLYAIARIAAPVSVPVLQQAAEKAGYTYDNTEAVSAYILYLHALIRKEKTDPEIAHAFNGPWVLTAVLALHKHAGDAGQVHTKIAALELLTEIDSSNGMLLLQDALKDKDITYRAAALGFAAKFQSPETDKQWLHLLPSLTPAAQVQVIDFLAKTGDESLLPRIQTFLKNNDKDVRIAAIAASSKIGGDRALPALLVVMKSGDTDEIAVVKTAILTMKGNNVTELVLHAFPLMPPVAKAALLDIAAVRSYNKAMDIVVAQMQGDDLFVGMAAAKALPSVAMDKDMPALFDLLNKGQLRYVEYVQQAIIAATSNIKDTLQRTAALALEMGLAGADRRYLYLDLLAVSGGNPALDVIKSQYETGDGATKNAAIEALSKSKQPKAARLLLNIALKHKGESGNIALDGYISVIKQSSFPEDEKLLMLKEAMPIAINKTQKKDIINQVGDCNTFLALIYAGNFLDDASVQQEAAHAVMSIALAHNEFNGEIVKTLLTKTMDVLQGTDADYERQAIKKYLASMPAGDGFVSMFNGKDLTGWKGLVANPIVRAKMNPDTLAIEQAYADKIMHEGWFAKDGLLVFGGNGENLCTVKQYKDFEMYVDWKITKEGDAGIYLRGSPQVQIWDTSRVSVGAQVGSGGLYNNQKYQSKPLVLADNAIGEWNSFHIIMRGDKVTVYLNGVLVTDNVVLENYWDSSLPIFVKEQIELQAHGTYVAYRDLYIKELTDSPPFVLSKEERKEGFDVLFDGANLDQWTGNTTGYTINQGSILVDTADGNPGNMYTKQQYGNFVLRFEFQLTPGANNGIGIRTPLEGDAAYVGMEIQVLDNEADEYKDLHAYQYHGSVYGVIPAKRGFLKPVGEWNYEEITANGPKIKVILNGEVILDGDIDEASKNGTADKREHPGLKRTAGHIGFLGHGSVVRFRNVRIKEL